MQYLKFLKKKHACLIHYISNFDGIDVVVIYKTKFQLEIFTLKKIDFGTN